MKPLLLSKISKPLLIAGPCSAESPKQLHDVAQSLQANNVVHLFRAGVWKPRTRPNSFEGVGERGLDWLVEIQEEYNLPVITEVANSQHVELALKRGIKHLWLGARTTVNPFSVQEIADACLGSDLAVFIKNPIHADVDLWQGSVERFYNNGLNNLAAIHRGFSSFINSEYRNLPNWKVPIELQRRIPDLPILCDPSHIAGSRELLPLVAQKALDINLAGLMVEVHPNPPKALSDSHQQLTPEGYINLIQNLQVRQEQAFSPELMDRLEELRGHIDKIDEDFITALASRLEVIKEIGEHKLNNNIAVFQLERWNEILKTRILLAEKLGLDPGFMKKLMELIHNESIRLQSDINKSLKEPQ